MMMLQVQLVAAKVKHVAYMGASLTVSHHTTKTQFKHCLSTSTACHSKLPTSNERERETFKFYQQ